MASPSYTTLYELLQFHAARTPTAPALLTVDHPTLTFGRLFEHAQSTLNTLNSLGIGRGDRVALIIVDNAVMASAFLAIATGATCVPLAVEYSSEDFKYYFSTLNVSAVVVEAGRSDEARLAAETLHLPVLDLHPQADAETGLFTLTCTTDKSPIDSERSGPASADELVMILTTSGTTGRAKAVPLSQWITAAGAEAIASEFGLSAQDRFFNLMSVRHSAGINEMIRVMAAGGSTIYVTDFNAAQFFPVLDQLRPTYSTATASIFRSVLAYASQYQNLLRNHSLRFLNTSAMALPPQLMEELERILGIPVRPSYGSSETGLISHNPMPPRPRKSGSVGLPINSTVRIRGNNGESLPPFEIGEVLVSGSRVISGYENNPEATAASFVDGWYITGDLGYKDEDGYIFLTGRAKEVINRGGEKISPLEVEEVLQQHPAVAEVAVFAVADPHVGEEVGAAVVLRENMTTATITEKDLQNFAADKLSNSKIPRQITFVAGLPKTSIGKVQRIGLAERLGIAPRPITAKPTTYIAASTPLQHQLVNLWAELLKIPAESISVDAHFRDLGGDSLTATRLIFRVREVTHIMVTILDFFSAPTITQQAEILEKIQQSTDSPRRASTLIPLKPSGTRYPLFCLHAIDGGVYFYEPLALALHPDQPIYAVQAVGMDGTEPPLTTLDAIVAHQLEEIQAVQSTGPYFLIGYSFGGNLAVEVAQRLKEAGQIVYIFLVDTRFQLLFDKPATKNALLLQVARGFNRLRSLNYAIFRLPRRFKMAYFRENLQWWVRRFGPNRKMWAEQRRARRAFNQIKDKDLPPTLLNVMAAIRKAGNTFVPTPYSGPITYIRAAGDDVNIPFFRAWDVIAKGPTTMIEVPGTHDTIMKEPETFQRITQELQKWLDSYQPRS